MVSIRIISTTTIQAPSHVNDNSTQKIHLTPWDLASLQIEMNQKGLLSHNPRNAKETTNYQIIHHLKHSLSSTLSFFPPLTGRIIITEHEDNNTASSFILCNNTGVLFVHAIAENTSVDDILRPNYVPPIVYSFFSLNGVRYYEGTSQPLLVVQVTELVDGIFIGVAITHMVADDKSFWHFINTWAEISRGSHKMSNLPLLDHWFPDNIRGPIRFPFIKEDTEHFESENSAEWILHFTKEKIVQLKSKANAEASSDKIISSLQALLSHLWHVVICCQRNEFDQHEEISYCLVINIRRRMVPPLSENYFGNTVLVGAVTMKATEMLKGGIGNVAFEMNKMIASHSDDSIKTHYESWVKTASLFDPGRLCNIKALGTSSSPRFNVYWNDFVWAKPVAVRSGCSNKSNGTITVFSRAEEGSVNIEVCLSYDIWRQFEMTLTSLISFN